jgi:hypothetical protein
MSDEYQEEGKWGMKAKCKCWVLLIWEEENTWNDKFRSQVQLYHLRYKGTIRITIDNDNIE